MLTIQLRLDSVAHLVARSVLVKGPGIGVLCPAKAGELGHVLRGLQLDFMACLEVAAQEKIGLAYILGGHGGLIMHSHGGVLNSLDDQCVEPAVIRVNFRALP